MPRDAVHGDAMHAAGRQAVERHIVEVLSSPQVQAVHTLAAAVSEHDGVEAFSEDTLLTLTRPGRMHFLLTRGGSLTGFAQLAGASAELAVHPDHRRRALGTRLLRAVQEADPHVRLWAHGNLPGAVALAARHGLRVVRELIRMARTPPPPTEPPAIPAGLSVRTFAVGSDEDAWLAVNARAFADHPEQGSLDRADLQARIDSDWFDPGTFWLARDAGTGAVLGSMWVKITRAEGSSAGEIYVLGVDPDAQGRGVGRLLTQVAMAHFSRAGLDHLELYVEGDNVAALRTYQRAGFTRAAVHVQYTAEHSPDRFEDATMGA